LSYINFDGQLKRDRANAIVIAIGSGATLNIYTGTQPATPDTTATGTLLATLPLSSTPATTALGANAVVTFNAIVQENANATGTAGWCRIANSAGNGIIDLDVGVSGESVIINTSSVVAGGPIVITSATITEA
jgi:hypothetical protein